MNFLSFIKSKLILFKSFVLVLFSQRKRLIRIFFSLFKLEEKALGQNGIVSVKDLRVFGFIWAAIFAFLSYKFSSHFKLYLGISFIFLFVSLLRPQIFFHTKVFQSWVRFGSLLGKINGFIISFILFYGIFSPVGIFLRATKKDLLKTKLEPSLSTYFLDRNQQPVDMKNQF